MSSIFDRSVSQENWKDTMIERFLIWVLLAFSSTSAVWQNQRKLCGALPKPSIPTVLGAQCELDPTCFKFATDCTINANDIEPFYREAPIDCIGCSALCQFWRNDSVHQAYYCRSAIWDACAKTCDLFAISVPTISVLAKHPGRVYIEPNYECRYPPAQTEPFLSTPKPKFLLPSCNRSEVAKVFGVVRHIFQNITGIEMLDIADDRACADLCIKNLLPNGTIFNCKSSQYLNGICTLGTNEPQANSQLVSAFGGTYFQKFCFPAYLVKGCPDTFYEEPNMILVGVNKHTVVADSLDYCVRECLNSSQAYGFVCKSIMFFYEDLEQNCVLNEETKGTRKSLFTMTAPGDEAVSYVEIPCASESSHENINPKFLFLSSKTKDVQVTGDQRFDTQITNGRRRKAG